MRKVCNNKPVCVGDTVIRRPKFTYDKDERNIKTMSGTVIYVHPAGRFHVVKFDGGVKETFAGVGIHTR